MNSLDELIAEMEKSIAHIISDNESPTALLSGYEQALDLITTLSETHVLVDKVVLNDLIKAHKRSQVHYPAFRELELLLSSAEVEK